MGGVAPPRGETRAGCPRYVWLLIVSSLQLAQTREISVWRLRSREGRGGKRKCPGPDFECRKDNGRPADRIARLTKALFAKVKLLEQLVVLRQVVPFQIIEELATAGSHLKKPAARVEVLAVRAQVLGQVIDASGEQRHLDFGRAGILVVSLIFVDDFGFNYCSGHGFVLWIHDCREAEDSETPASPEWKSGQAGVTVPIPRRRDQSVVGPRNRRDSTNAREENP